MISATIQSLNMVSAADGDAESNLIKILQSGEASRKEKADACRILARIGTERCVQPLAVLLFDKELSHMARYGLEPNTSPKVNPALREALEVVNDEILVGVIGSLGVREDAEAVKPIAKHLISDNAEVKQMAARALGKIGTADASEALIKALPKARGQNLIHVCEGLLRCAENIAAQGFKKEAHAIYKKLNSIKEAPHQIQTAAALGLAK